MSRTNPVLVVPPTGSSLAIDAGRARRIRALAQLLDNAIPVPGTSWRFGLDAIIGLIPVVGDMIGGALSAYIILEAAQAEVPKLTLLRMLMNVGIDTLVGSVPALGDLFDAAWKANIKNVALLERHMAVSALPPRKRRVTGETALAVVVMVLIVAAGLALGVVIARLLWGLATR